MWNGSPQVQIKSFRTLPTVFCSYFKEVYTETRKDMLPAGRTRVFRDSGNASCPLTLSLVSTTCVWLSNDRRYFGSCVRESNRIES